MESDRFKVPFDALKAAMDKNLSGTIRETTPSFGEAVNNLQSAYARYGGRKPFARATGLPESTLRRWEAKVSEGKTPKITQANSDRLTGALRKVERVMRLDPRDEQRLRTKPNIILRATFTGQTERGERSLILNHTKKDKDGFKRAANKLVGAYIAGSRKGMLDAFDDMIEAYEPDIADSYFAVDTLGAIKVF